MTTALMFAACGPSEKTSSELDQTTTTTIEQSAADESKAEPIRPIGSAGGSNSGDLDSLNLTRFVVQGTVVAIGGPEVTITDDDLVDYELGDDVDFPSVQISLDGTATDFGRDDLFDDGKLINTRAENGAPLEFIVAGGKLDVGRRYAVFLIPWEPGLPAAVYAFDIDNDAPAPGFSQGFDQLQQRREELGIEFGSGGSNLDWLLEYTALVGSPNDPLARAAAEAEAEAEQLENLGNPDAYPNEFDASADDLAGLVRIRVAVWGAETEDIYALRGPERHLGFFGVNGNGRALIIGFVDPNTSYQLVRFERGQSLEIDLGEPLAGDEIVVGSENLRRLVNVDGNQILSIEEN
ncbi:MAG: hypothetical protein R8J94_22735 [Acidimicrobiia bacterium]|nr:hypothetical protein [Acidimicrobiia bacterium]